MDKITLQELSNAIVYESERSPHATKLGHALDTIFEEFHADIPLPESLVVPRITVQKYHPTFKNSNTEDIHLYDRDTKCWNWPLPSQGNATKMNGWGAETLIAAFFNIVATAMESKVKAVVLEREENLVGSKLKDPIDPNVPPHRHWLSSYSNRRLPGTADGAGAFDRHPDLILVESASYAPQSLSWTDPVVLAEFTTENWTPTCRLAKTLHTKAYLAFLDQPWRRFVLCLSLCKQFMRAHLYDRSGLCVSRPFDIHERPDMFLSIIAAVVFGARRCVGFDPTVTITLIRPIRAARRRLIDETTGIPSTIHEDENEKDEGYEGVISCRNAGDTSMIDPDSTPPSHVDDSNQTIDASPPSIIRPFSLPEHVDDSHLTHPDSFLSIIHSSRTDDPDEIHPNAVDTCIRQPAADTVSRRPAPLLDSTVSPARIGWIRVGKTLYELLDVLFSSPGFLGRATIIYLARRDGQTYIIKDHWIENPGNETKMMESMKGVPGVPVVVEYCKVEISEGIVDKTSRYREERERGKMKGDRVHVRTVMSPWGRPLTQFKTKHELVKSVMDVLLIQKEADARGILHRDTSPSNILMEDIDGGVRGMLIDWEFAVEKTFIQKYSVGGTGTIPFLSRSLLSQISQALRERSANKVGNKKDLISSITLHTVQDFTVQHTAQDDIESLFYVLLWIAILYDGPGGKERENFDFDTSILSQWTESAVQNLDAAKNCKQSLLTELNFRFEDHLSPYFKDLTSLLESWRQIFRVAEFTGSRVDIENCINIFQTHLETFSPSPVDTYSREEATKALEASMSHIKELPKHLQVIAQNKRQRDIRSLGDKPRLRKRARDEVV